MEYADPTSIETMESIWVGEDWMNSELLEHGNQLKVVVMFWILDLEVCNILGKN